MEDAPAQDIVGAAGPVRSRRAVGGLWKEFWFRVLGVSFPIAVLAAVNGGLGWAGVGVNSSFVLPCPAAPPQRVFLNPKADYPYCLADLRGPEPRAFALPKDEHVFRVVVAGESTVQGYPYSSELAFPRQLELVLQRQLPERKIEVLNAGIIGISSTLLVDVVRHVLKIEPDLLVVYAGHNEFYGVGGVATNAPVRSWQIAVRRAPIAQLFLTPQSLGGGGDLISRLPQQLEISPNDTVIRQAETTYAANMRKIIRLAESAEVSLLLCGVAGNLRDQSPRLMAGSALPDQAPATKALDSARYDATDPTSLPTLVAAVERHPENAVLHYRLGQAYEAAGDADLALREYTEARDCDPCRYRALSSFTESLQSAAATADGSRVKFLDLAAAFQQETRFAAPGGDLFLEHVHFNSHGHWLAARTLGRCITEQFLQATFRSEAVPDEHERDERLGFLPEDDLTAHMLAWFLTQRAPFDRAVDASHHQSELALKIQGIDASLTPERKRRLAGLPNQVKVDDLVDGLGRSLIQEGDFVGALELFQTGRRRRPWMQNSFVFAAVCLERLGRIDEAYEALRQADQASLAPMPVLQRVRDDVERKLKSASNRRNRD